jgi:hypothetical protein
MNSRLIIDSDLTVKITRLTQWPVYSGMAEGYPCEYINNHLLENIKTEAKAIYGREEIYIIDPETKPFPYNGNPKMGKPLTLPAIVCVAALLYNGVFRDLTKDDAYLGLVWFQDEYAFPIPPDILEKIKKVPFRQLCYEGNF